MKTFNCLEGIGPRVKLSFVKFLVFSVLWLCLMMPGVVSAQVIDLPDANLRAAIAEALGKAPGDAITRAEMETLVELRASGRGIADLRGIGFAINLTRLNVYNNSISDISALANLTNLTSLTLSSNSISDISAVTRLTDLTWLNVYNNSISDISALATLTNLTSLNLSSNTVSDISALANLINLTGLRLMDNTISDLSSLVSNTGLGDGDEVDVRSNPLNAVSINTHIRALQHRGVNVLFDAQVQPPQSVNIPDANLRAAIAEALNKAPGDVITRAEMETLSELQASGRGITDLQGIEFAINLTWLNVYNNSISDISALANLTNLTSLTLSNNSISDISALANLTNLTWLNVYNNSISDISALANLTNLTSLNLSNNNVSDIETLERLMAQGTVVYFSGNPAFETPGPKIEEGWIWLIVPATDVSSGADAAGSGRDFLSEASGGVVTEADVALNGASAGTQVGNSVWTAATLAATDPDNLNTIVTDYNLGTDIPYPVAYGVVSIPSETLQETRVYIGGGPVKVYLNGTLVYGDTNYRGVSDYETAVPVVLMPGENLLFIAAYRQSSTSQWCAFFGFQDSTAPPGNLDINGDGQVNIIDLMWVAIFYGMRGEGLLADVNADGIVNVEDFAAVAAGVDAANPIPQWAEHVLFKALEQAVEIEDVAAAPMGFRMPQHALSRGLVYDNVAAALADVRVLAGGDVRLEKGITVLEGLLALLAEMRAIPEATALLPNYPNPFNPETWIPYRLMTDADVTLTIYDVRGSVVRELVLGHQTAGVYESRGRAAYWDGGNQQGEPVASGVYFYTLTAGEFTATRKLLITK